jgi:hypothetical protein
MILTCSNWLTSRLLSVVPHTALRERGFEPPTLCLGSRCSPMFLQALQIKPSRGVSICFLPITRHISRLPILCSYIHIVTYLNGPCHIGTMRGSSGSEPQGQVSDQCTGNFLSPKASFLSTSHSQSREPPLVFRCTYRNAWSSAPSGGGFSDGLRGYSLGTTSVLGGLTGR